MVANILLLNLIFKTFLVTCSLLCLIEFGFKLNKMWGFDINTNRHGWQVSKCSTSQSCLEFQLCKSEIFVHSKWKSFTLRFLFIVKYVTNSHGFFTLIWKPFDHLCDRGICNISGALAFFYTTWWGNLHIKHFTWCLKKTGSQLLSPDTHRDPQMNVDTLPTTPADQSPRLKLTHWGSASRCQGPIFKRTLPSYSITFCISSAPITWRSKGNRHAGTLSVMMSELRYAT